VNILPIYHFTSRKVKKNSLKKREVCYDILRGKVGMVKRGKILHVGWLYVNNSE